MQDLLVRADARMQMTAKQNHIENGHSLAARLVCRVLPKQGRFCRIFALAKILAMEKKAHEGNV
jgi:hypothetical protein